MDPRYAPDDREYFILPHVGETIGLRVSERLADDYHEIGRKWGTGRNNGPAVWSVRRFVRTHGEQDLAVEVESYEGETTMELADGTTVTVLDNETGMIDAALLEPLFGPTTQSDTGLMPVGNFVGLVRWDPREHPLADEQ